MYLDNLVLEPRLALLLLPGGADGGEVGDDLLGVFRLTRAGLASSLKIFFMNKTLLSTFFKSGFVRVESLSE